MLSMHQHLTICLSVMNGPMIYGTKILPHVNPCSFQDSLFEWQNIQDAQELQVE